MLTSFESTSTRKRFFVEDKEEGKTFPVSFVNNFLIITTIYGDKVMFSKSNRSKMFRDSRQPKKPIFFEELLSEVTRLLDSPEKAREAVAKLT